MFVRNVHKKKKKKENKAFRVKTSQSVCCRKQDQSSMFLLQ